MAKDYSFTLSREEFADACTNIFHDHSIQIDPTAASGELDAFGAKGKWKFDDTDNQLLISVDSKPFFVSWNLVESMLDRYFANRSA
jgi:hypothetical protein